MRVAQYYNNHDVRIEERPIPKIGPGEILMKIRATGICGSDVMEWYRVGKGPRILGHEVAGVIAKIGDGVNDLREGDRIAASHHVPCYECHECRLGNHTLCDTLKKTNFDPGGFSEWIRLPEINVRHGVYKLPDHVSFDEAACIEPLACVVRGQRKINLRKGQTLFVIGCGVSGLLHILAARCRGIERILASDINDYRLETARRIGVSHLFKAAGDLTAELQEANEGRLPDVVIVCAGAQEATRKALESVGRGGTVLFFALQGPDQVMPVSMNELFWQKGVTMTSSYAASPEDHREALNWIGTGQVNVRQLITHQIGLSDIAKGFDLVSKAEESIKVIVDPTY